MQRTLSAACAMVLTCAVAGPATAQHEHHAPPVRLDSITVHAERDAVRLRSGATVVDVRASTAAGGTIADVLRTVPGIEIDADGRIIVRGSAALVLLNGRPMSLTGDALAAYLRQMPASALERVEAGTTAASGASAEGAAVVNLVLRDHVATSTRSLAASLAADDHYMASAAAASRAGGILRWDVMYSLSAMRPRTNTGTSRWSNVPGDLPLSTRQVTRARERHRLHSVHTGVAAAPTSRTSIALRGTRTWMEGAYHDRSSFDYANDAGFTGSSRTASALEHAIPAGELSLVVHADVGVARITSEATAGFVKQDLRGEHRDDDAGYSFMTTVLASRQKDRTVRSSVEMRVREADLEIGHEARFRTLSARHELMHFNATARQAFRYERDIHAAWIAAHRPFGALHVEAGVRAEADRTRLDFDSGGTSRAFRILPQLSAQWNDAGRGGAYRVAYARRIGRPEAAMLNPFSMGEDDMHEVIGNPRLKPEISDQLELGLERHRPRLTLQLTPFVRWSRNRIRQIRVATASGTTTSTLVNVPRARLTGADANVRVRAADRAIITVAGTLAHQTTSGRFAGSGVHASVRFTTELRLAQNTTLHLYTYSRTAETIEQGELAPSFSTDIALTQRLAGERSRITLRVADPLRTERLRFSVADTDFTQQSRRVTARPLLSLFASWAVGTAPREEAPDWRTMQ